MNISDPKYLGIPNIQFSLTEKSDKRDEEFSKQRIERGFDDSETWSLDGTFAAFMLPRLIRFQSITRPNNYDGIDINLMIEACELILRDHGSRTWTTEESNKVSLGLQEFSDNILSLWW
jgi:hypothetical protein